MVKKILWGLGGLGLLIAGLGIWLYLTDDFFAPVAMNDLSWRALGDGSFTAENTLRRTQEVCAFGGYESTANVEATHVRYEGLLRPYYVIIRDPNGMTDPNWGTPVTTTLHCVSKSKGDRLLFILTPKSEAGSDGKSYNFLTLTLR